VATGAVAGALPGSRKRAAVAGPLLHALLDVVPHEDIESRRFEISSTLVLLALLAATGGPLDPAVIGAITSSSSFHPIVGVGGTGGAASGAGCNL
jgi:hypothetical protein